MRRCQKATSRSKIGVPFPVLDKHELLESGASTCHRSPISPYVITVSTTAHLDPTLEKDWETSRLIQSLLDLMVLLIPTPAIKLAIHEYGEASKDDSAAELFAPDPDSPIQHHDLIAISQYLTRRFDDGGQSTDHWRVDTLLKGATIYQQPPPPKPEPVGCLQAYLSSAKHTNPLQTPQYKALMRKLRQQEEQRQYERMTNPLPQAETFRQRFPNSPYDFDPATSHGQSARHDEVDEVTYADVNRQMILIINVLVSVIACSVAIWIVARRWSVPQRLALSLSGSGIVAFAEVAIYLGYINRIEDAKGKEVKAVEVKEVVDTWIIDKSVVVQEKESVRFRKGRNR